MSLTQINLAETPDFDLGGLRVSPAHRLVGENGEQKELEPKVVQVLVALASARPQVVSRDRLIEQCWDGRIVGDDALNRCIVALRQLARQFSPEPFAIETVTRVGYCLVERPADEAVAVRRSGPRFTMTAAALLFLVLMAIGIGIAVPRFGRADASPASIAVLPFRNLSAGDPYFAEGIGEEILGQLAREPQFRVAGSISSSQVGKDGDVRAAARKLNVDYVVEGSVRRQGERVRVNADLLRAKDGLRLWSDTYDGGLQDVIAIQQRIGGAIAVALRRKLISSSDAARPVNGEAYALYLNARGLVRSGNPQSGQDAAALLRESIRLDPTYAPAWASLANALELDGRTKGNEGLVAAWPEAYNSARHALELDPNLAEAHGEMADLLGNEAPDAAAHLRRAAALDPRSGQGLMWLSSAHTASGEFDQATAAVRRAHDADPLWPFPTRALVDLLAANGDRAGADALIRTSFPDDPMTQNFAMARVARLLGDDSEAARRWSVVAQSQSRWADPSRSGLEQVLFNLHLAKNPPQPSARSLIGGSRFVAAPPSSAAPVPSEWQKQNRSLAASLVYADENAIAAKQMLLAGRSAELARTYDGPTGLLRIHKDEEIAALRIRDVPIVVLALRQQGRSAEADALLRRADATVRAVYSHGAVPIFFDEDAAGIWASEGKTDLAVAALERAFRRGWLHVGHTDFPRLEDEPAFRPLRGNPRFEALVAKREAHFASERAETARALHLKA